MQKKNESIGKKIAELREIIDHHNELYYQKDAPSISDQEYDSLFRELKRLEEEFPEFDSPQSPTKKVGAKPVDSFEKFRHIKPMLSLDSVYEDSEIVNFDKRVKKAIADTSDHADYVCEPKLDGLSVEVQYTKGAYNAGSTRGDGYYGEDITPNILTIKNLPLLIKGHRHMPDFISLRGEVIIPISAFNELNKDWLESGRTPFANCRNAAAGSLRLLDSRITAKRPLIVYFYDILEISGITFETHMDEINYIKETGLPVVPDFQYCRSIVEALEYRKRIEMQRKNLDLEIDGIVIKINSNRLKSLLGEKERSPRWALAVKFSPDQTTTRILNIVCQVGRTGIITPVAELEPVSIKGARISRVSLHNFDYIRDKDIHLYDEIIIQRAGDVIPEVVSVIRDSRDGDQQAILPPQLCPQCKSPVYREGAYFYCPSSISCPAQIMYSINHFAGKQGMDIRSLSSRTIATLMQHKAINNIADLYSLKEEDLISLPLFGKKSSHNLIQAIDKSKERPIAKFIYALGIKGVGTHISSVLARKFNDLDSLRCAGIDELMDIDEIGPVISKNIFQFFRNQVNAEIINKLLRLGVNPLPYKNTQNSPLAQTSFVITGTLENLTRNEVHDLIVQRGGNVHNAVSKKTSYLVMGKDPGSKLLKARSLGIKIITEEEFIKLLNPF